MTKAFVPPGYRIVELNVRVPTIEPEIFRWKWRAERRCRKMNDGRLVPFYRYEVCDWLDGRWGVVAMQNHLQPISLAKNG